MESHRVRIASCPSATYPTVPYSHPCVSCLIPDGSVSYRGACSCTKRVCSQRDNFFCSKLKGIGQKREDQTKKRYRSRSRCVKGNWPSMRASPLFCMSRMPHARLCSPWTGLAPGLCCYPGGSCTAHGHRAIARGAWGDQ
jgi:hypothetical protein